MIAPGKAIQVLSAGSMRHAFPVIIEAFRQATGIGAALTLGPAGLLRERIEAGDHFDLFASANMAHPQRLALLGIGTDAACFARNRLCVLARSDLGLTTANFVDVITDPRVRIGTSTPGDDPAGDYAFEVFSLIEASHPGLGDALKSRARQLLGGRNSPQPPPGRSSGWLVADGKVDIFLSYYSNARLLEADPALSIVNLRQEFSPVIEYGVTVRKDADVKATRLRDFLLCDEGQRILGKYGFESVC
ncbi:molybdate ABC transporter substrate-binding protein [Rhizobium sp. 2YAF20]|uniref:molybdate ABC transporter substrate-binding protein n=1 Tax=Rhizobium sp. 2YAF20 TaxID=3233027 RepID=UPI003F9C40BA